MRPIKQPKLDGGTEIDVVITKGEKCKIQRMTIDQWKVLKRHPGFRYQPFQVGYHGYKQNVE